MALPDLICVSFFKMKGNSESSGVSCVRLEKFKQLLGTFWKKLMIYKSVLHNFLHSFLLLFYKDNNSLFTIIIKSSKKIELLIFNCSFYLNKLLYNMNLLLARIMSRESSNNLFTRILHLEIRRC